MKYFVTFIVLFAFVAYSQQGVCPERREKMKQIYEKCIKETNVDPELLKKAHSGGAVDDKNVKCFHKCFMVEVGTMDADGTVHFEKMGRRIPAGEKRDKFLAALAKCTAVKGADACDTAYAIHTCLGAARNEIIKQ